MKMIEYKMKPGIPEPNTAATIIALITIVSIIIIILI
jgi:hypothetical protein